MSFLRAIALKSQKGQAINKTENSVRVPLETNAEPCKLKPFLKTDFQISKKQ